jgi:hypothetical protein
MEYPLSLKDVVLSKTGIRIPGRECSLVMTAAENQKEIGGSVRLGAGVRLNLTSVTTVAP